MMEDDWAITLQVFAAAQSRRGQPGRNDRKFLEALHFFTVHNLTWRALPATFVTLFQAPTIASLAAVMRASSEDRFSCLVPVVPGNGRPLFLVHGLSGTVLELARLVNAMRGGTPVTVFHARGLDPASQPHDSVETMAAHYPREVRAAQPAGPYALAGFSFGGLVGYEMARMLAADGEEVEFLGLIDTSLHPRTLSWPDWIGYRRHRLAMLGRDVIANPWRTVVREANSVRNGALLRLGRPPHWQDPLLAAMPPLLQRVRAACEAAYTDYRPRPYAGRVTFIRALSRDPRLSDPLQTWQRLAKVDVVPVACWHLELVQPPYVGELAAALRTRLSVRPPAPEEPVVRPIEAAASPHEELSGLLSRGDGRAISQGSSNGDWTDHPHPGADPSIRRAVVARRGCRPLQLKRGRPIGVESSMHAEPPRSRIWRSCPSTLADVVARTDALAIACSTCDRAAQYPVATLIEQYGPQFAVADLLRLLAVGCPMRESISPYALCGIHAVRPSKSERL